MGKFATNKNFCSRLKELFEENDVKPAKVAKAIGIDRGTLDRYMKAPNNSPYLKYVIALADYFDVSVSYLVGETDTRRPNDIDIGNNLGIDYKTMENLRKIKDINSKYNNQYTDLLSNVITNPDMYHELVKQTNILLNNNLKKFANERIEENKKKMFGKDDILEFNDFANILICQKFLEYYTTYITFKYPVNLTENQLKTKEAELKKQLRDVRIQLKKYAK